VDLAENLHDIAVLPVNVLDFIDGLLSKFP
jgi:hypothetical protein